MDQSPFLADESKIFVQITLINVGITAVYPTTCASFTYITIQTHAACSMVIIRTSGHYSSEFYHT